MNDDHRLVLDEYRERFFAVAQVGSDMAAESLVVWRRMVAGNAEDARREDEEFLQRVANA